ncbi:unnamed protein product [Vitrella brassicaformis CCMP3155]|uniref:Alpha-amylase n=1 Tax=Vitrella brassicaformis (strain CCMP3155) TaxID=1169540 RepID=A0A0G4H433_VITBC|nr:unnamed protein product [Vitrella brassicaformis CCMP3155]|eukprot:CEM38500.1 unnamed protein product [Vitrella brassicaformis CCMP3155]
MLLSVSTRTGPSLQVLVAWLLALACEAKSPAEWISSRRVVYQLIVDRFASFEDTCGIGNCTGGNVCGGTWEALANNLPYIKGMEFNAIYISPIMKNLPCGYHGYHPLDWTSLNDRLGTAKDLRKLVAKAHQSDIWVMVDVVVNNAGPNTDVPEPMNWTQVVPFNSPKYYHPYCPMDFENETSNEVCWLWKLPDLNESIPFVREFLINWTAGLSSKWGFDGLRLDAVKHMPIAFWQELSAAIGEDTYAIGEVLSQKAADVAPYQYDRKTGGTALDGLFNYPLYFALRDVFVDRGSMWKISGTLNDVKRNIKDPRGLGVFVDSHDLPRFLRSQKDVQLYKSALTFVLSTEGIPFIYYGTEQGDDASPEVDGEEWTDEHNRKPLWRLGYSTEHPLFRLIKTMNSLRHAGVFDGPQEEIWVDDHVYVFARGTTLVMTSNVGKFGVFTQNLPLSTLPIEYQAGGQACNLLARLWAEDASTPQPDGPAASPDVPLCYNVTQDGLTFRSEGGWPMVLVPRNGDGEQPQLIEEVEEHLHAIRAGEGEGGHTSGEAGRGIAWLSVAALCVVWALFEYRLRLT